LLGSRVKRHLFVVWHDDDGNNEADPAVAVADAGNADDIIADDDKNEADADDNDGDDEADSDEDGDGDGDDDANAAAADDGGDDNKNTDDADVDDEDNNDYNNDCVCILYHVLIVDVITVAIGDRDSYAR